MGQLDRVAAVQRQDVELRLLRGVLGDEGDAVAGRRPVRRRHAQPVAGEDPDLFRGHVDQRELGVVAVFLQVRPGDDDRHACAVGRDLRVVDADDFRQVVRRELPGFAAKAPEAMATLAKATDEAAARR